MLNAGGVKRRGSRRPWRAEHVFRSLREQHVTESVAAVQAGMQRWAGMSGYRKPPEEA